MLDVARASKFPLPLSSTAAPDVHAGLQRGLCEGRRQRRDQDLPGIELPSLEPNLMKLAGFVNSSIHLLHRSLLNILITAAAALSAPSSPAPCSQRQIGAGRRRAKHRDHPRWPIAQRPGTSRPIRAFVLPGRPPALIASRSVPAPGTDVVFHLAAAVSGMRGRFRPSHDTATGCHTRPAGWVRALGSRAHGRIRQFAAVFGNPARTSRCRS